jgi:hypothetical protein
MGGRSAPLALLLSILTVGCNSSLQLVLKPPVEEKCKDAGLRGCEEMTDGVLL